MVLSGTTTSSGSVASGTTVTAGSEQRAVVLVDGDDDVADPLVQGGRALVGLDLLELDDEVRVRRAAAGGPPR